MMWIPLRSVKMNRFIFGFQRWVWWPKWTPASSISRIDTTDMGYLLRLWLLASAPFVPPSYPSTQDGTTDGPGACEMGSANG